MKRLWLLPALVAISGCVRLSTYRQLQTQQQLTAQGLQESQAQAVKLKQDNDKLTADLVQARKEMAEFVSNLKSDLSQAQLGLSAAMKLVEETGGPSAPAAGASQPNRLAPAASASPPAASDAGANSEAAPAPTQ